MPINILMPALSPTMEHGNLSQWLKKEGDQIVAGEVIAEIETDKATMEVEAVEEGMLGKILIPSGSEEVAVNSVIAVLLEDGETDDDLKKHMKEFDTSQSTVSSDTKTSESTEAQENIAQNNPQNIAQSKHQPEEINQDRIYASPLAKRIAKNEAVNIADIGKGSGPRGRIIKRDILRHLETKIEFSKGAAQRNSLEYELVKNNNIRKVIAKRLTESKQNIPHFYLSIECSMDNLLAARQEINASLAESKESGNTKLKISVNDFVIAAVARALKDIPDANASWGDDAIKRYNNVDVSVAVAIDNGLITPVIRNADQKTLVQISTEMKDLAKRARNNGLKPEEFQGGGFTISNLGMYGIKNFKAIINPPQSCILAVGASSERAIIDNGQIKIGTVMDISLSCDHRVVDGAVGAMFLNSFKKYIEAPILMFI